MDTTQTTLDLPGGDNPLKPERVQKGAALAAAAVPLLSLPVAVSVSGGQVVVTLHARRNRGRLGAVTDAVLDFARRLG